MAPSTVRGHACHLTVDSEGKRIAYPCMNNVAVRDISNGDTKLFMNHANNITAVRFGNMPGIIASGDEKGFFKVWNANHPKFNVSFESKILNDHIRDLAFSEDCKRGAAVGEGVNEYAYD